MTSPASSLLGRYPEHDPNNGASVAVPHFNSSTVTLPRPHLFEECVSKSYVADSPTTPRQQPAGATDCRASFVKAARAMAAAAEVAAEAVEADNNSGEDFRLYPMLAAAADLMRKWHEGGLHIHAAVSAFSRSRSPGLPGVIPILRQPPVYTPLSVPVSATASKQGRSAAGWAVHGPGSNRSGAFTSGRRVDGVSAGKSSLQSFARVQTEIFAGVGVDADGTAVERERGDHALPESNTPPGTPPPYMQFAGRSSSQRGEMSGGGYKTALEKGKTKPKRQAKNSAILDGGNPTPQTKRLKKQSTGATISQTIMYNGESTYQTPEMDPQPRDGPARQMREGGQWSRWVLELGAKDRNAAIREANLNDDEIRDLKRASRRMKLLFAQRRYMRKRNLSGHQSPPQVP